MHRTIREIFENEKTKIDRAELKTLGKYCSMTERRADEATNQALGSLKCEYMLNKLGNEYDGVINGVTGFGLFVELQDIFIDGLVHINTLKDDHYLFEPIRHRLVGKHTGKIYRIGDVLKVKVMEVEVENKEINLILI